MKLIAICRRSWSLLPPRRPTPLGAEPLPDDVEAERVWPAHREPQWHRSASSSGLLVRARCGRFGG